MGCKTETIHRLVATVQQNLFRNMSILPKWCPIIPNWDSQRRSREAICFHTILKFKILSKNSFKFIDLGEVSIWHFPFRHSPFWHFPSGFVPYRDFSCRHFPYGDFSFRHFPFRHFFFGPFPFIYFTYRHFPFEHLPFGHFPFGRFPFGYYMPFEGSILPWKNFSKEF